MNCIVFDKTGTLTVGKPVVVKTRLFTNMQLGDFYELVAAAEVNSNLFHIIYFEITTDAPKPALNILD